MGRGRGRGKRTQRRDFAEKRDKTWTEKRQPGERGGWSDEVESNGQFEAYYKAQGICPEEEWDAFLAALRKPLPITFRINGTGKFATDLRERLETDFMSRFSDEPMEIEGEGIKPPRPLPWYPSSMAWHMDFSRRQLRKEPILGQLHEFMKREQEVGGITRQEAVSMVPPLFLHVEPHHRVLDMCAAPGSKTMQLLEALHAGPEPPTGLVIANDADLQRCNLLTHQIKRINSPALLVTNHEAQNFPLLPNLDPAEEDTRVLFDRILCDVPCSGDGTMRKAPDIWRRWNVGSGNGLHPLQLRITLRACELLRVGGLLVYSTCSFNPVEDEAVVAEVLRRTGDAFELLDVSGDLPALRRMPGHKRWRITDRSGQWYESWEQGQKGSKLDPTMFPDAASDALPLERCMRFLPHHQDTGGFFVAVLKKLKPVDRIPPPSSAHRQTKGRELKEEAQERKRARVEAAAEGGEPRQQLAEAEAEPEAAEEEAAEEAEVKEEEEAVNEQQEQEEEQPAAAAAAGAAGVEEQQQRPRGPPPVVKGLPDWVEIRRSREPQVQETVEGEDEAAANKRKQRERQGWRRGIDPVLPYVDEQALADIASFYGLPADCLVPGALIARTTEARPKRLHYVSPSVKRLLQSDTRQALSVTAAGVKVFERQESRDGILACAYRVAQDGVGVMLPFLSKQVFAPTLPELLLILQGRYVALPDEAKVHITARQQRDAEAEAAEGAAGGGAGAEAAEQQQGGQQQQPLKVASGSMSNPATLEQLKGLSYGCCVAVLRPDDASRLGLQAQQLGGEAPLVLSCWRGRGSLNVLVSKQECAQVAERLLEAARHAGVELPAVGGAAGSGAAAADGAAAGEVAAEVAGDGAVAPAEGAEAQPAGTA